MAIPGALLWLGSRETEAGRTKLDDFLALGLNEMGDAIAGVAATIALLWLIVTAFMQRAELRDQRRQLELATHESARMAEALKAQAEVFRDEQLQRAQARSAADLAAKVENLIAFVQEHGQDDSVLAGLFDLGAYPQPASGGVISTPFAKYSGASSAEEFLRRMNQMLSERIGKMHEWVPGIAVEERNPSISLEVYHRLSSISRYANRVSYADYTRLDTLRVGATIELLRFALLKIFPQLERDLRETPQ